MTIFNLQVFGIRVTVDDFGGNGEIVSDLREDDGDEVYNAAMDGIESMILAHACAGIKICSPAYVEGIETAVQACANNL